MDAAAWIRSRLVDFTCAACGTPFERQHIRVLAQREALFFVALDCRACATESVAIISLQTAAGVDEQTMTPAVASADAVVRAADVLAMHEFLRGFEGDFQGLFGASRERPSGSAGA